MDTFQATKKNLDRTLDFVLDLDYPDNIVLNINFPDIVEGNLNHRFTRQGKRDIPAHTMEERIDPRGQKYYWIGFKRAEGGMHDGTDLDCIQKVLFQSRQLAQIRQHIHFFETKFSHRILLLKYNIN